MRTFRAALPLVMMLVAAEFAAPAMAGAAAFEPPPLEASNGTVSVVVVGDDVLDPGTIAAASDGTASDSHTIAAIGTTTIEVPAAEVAGTIAELRRVRGVDSVYREQRATAFDLIPNDPEWYRQGPLASIGMPGAWATTTGSPTTIIAVIDTGVDNIAAFGSRLLPGYDFVNRDSSAVDDSDAYHGTDAALIAAGGGNDNDGTAGICWNCRILPVKVLDSIGEGSLTDVAEGIVFAADRGAGVINLSLGSGYPDPAVTNAVNYALARDVVVVASAGNNGTTDRNYPAANPGVLSVAGSNEARTLYPWSQRGPTWVDLAAPGCNVVDDGDPQGPYNFCGTSSASPVVAGLAGLLRSTRGDENRDMVLTSLVSTADYAPTAGLVGYGIVDARRAMATMLTVGPGAPPLPPDVTPPEVSISGPAGYQSGVFNLAVNSSDDQAVTGVEVRMDGELISVLSWPQQAATLAIDTTGYPDGEHRLLATAVDRAGHRTDTNQLAVATDNHNPLGFIFGPANGSRVSGSFAVRAFVTDPNGIMGTFIIANNQVIGGFPGDGLGQATMVVRRNGPIRIVALTVDRAGHISGTNVLAVNGVVAKRRR